MSEPRTDRWQLPDGVDELLPGPAWRVETLRRAFIDGCRSWGFELVMPPLIEYVDNLLTGSGETLELQTFKLVDQHSGRTLGVRADMTPQVARMDAHALGGAEPARLCYTGTVLRTRADGAGGSRSPQQFGAELFGHAGVESDIEICRLMLETVRLAGVPARRTVLDLGHVGVYRALVADLGLAAAEEAGVFEALRRGSLPDLDARLAALGTGTDGATEGERLRRLCHLRGGDRTIARAREELNGAGEGVTRALDELDELVAAVRETHPDVALHVDLAELRGYAYHTGALFALHDDDGTQLARGGRYDRIGESFGRVRPATGFSGDLKRLADRARALRDEGPAPTKGESDSVRVDVRTVAQGWPEIVRRRASGERIVFDLPDAGGSEGAAADAPDSATRFRRELVRDEGR